MNKKMRKAIGLLIQFQCKFDSLCTKHNNRQNSKQRKRNTNKIRLFLCPFDPLIKLDICPCPLLIISSKYLSIT